MRLPNGSPVLDAAIEMRENGENDAEALYRIFYKGCPDPETQLSPEHRFLPDPETQLSPGHHFLHALVQSITPHMPYASHWTEGFWGWWQEHGPK